ncbi:oxidoreductase [Angomonas deanei]|nr:oxidoreductase [Angomonas deanei]|eukprot:EPY43032.1 oxidoreductase [Angomonas deanei]
MTMKAVSLKEFGGPENFFVQEVEKAALRNEDDVLIKVMAAGLNRADTLQRVGKYPPPPGDSEVLGLEVSGVVAEVGKNVKKFKPGDKVMSLLGGGGYAEYTVTHQGCVMPMPKNYSFIEAAAIPEAFLTAWQCLKFHGNVQKGQHVLVHAGASGVGTAACQLVERHFGAKAVTTSSTGKIEICKNFASICVDRTPDETGLCFAPKIKNAVDAGMDVILDPRVGETYLTEDASVVAENGKIVVLSLMGGSNVFLNSVPLLQKRAEIIFTRLRSESMASKARLVASFTEEVMGAIEDRTIVPAANKSFPLDDIIDAHIYLDDPKSWGKVVLTVNSPLA